jgi:hypothetical protein
VQRNSLKTGNFKINPVTDFSIFAGFTCLSPDDTDRDLDNFIRQDARRHYEDGIAVTYALTREDHPKEPLGFATLQNDAIVIDRENLLPEVAEYPYASFPAVKIGRFGIQLEYQRNKTLHLGSLFLFMFKNLLLHENRTGCRFITVDARRDKKNKVDTTAFYEKNGFTLLPCRAKTSRYIPMYFDLKILK